MTIVKKIKLTVVIPAYNEQNTVRKVVKTALSTPGVDRVVLVDDGSTDNTVKNVRDLPIKIVKHYKNKGYTKALQTGIKAVNSEYVAIIDADWRNITIEAIKKIIAPLLKDEADLVKASFQSSRGRATKFAVRPMMSILFPNYNFEQPISGQFAGRTDFFRKVEVDTSWGIAIAILLDAIKYGLRIVEVNVGKLTHKARSDEDKAQMAKEVMETMIKKAGLISHKYKLIIFSLDEVLINTSSFVKALEELGLSKGVRKAIGDIENNKKPIQMIERAAKILDGVELNVIRDIVKNVKVPKNSKNVISRLKARRYNVALFTTNFYQVAKPIAQKIGIDNVEAIKLKEKKGRIVGELTTNSKKDWSQNNLTTVLYNAIHRLAKKNKIKMKEIILVTSSQQAVPLLDKIGLSVAYKPKSQELRQNVDKTISILPELLFIVE